LVYEPRDLVQTTQKDKVYMVGSFDWTVTNRGKLSIDKRNTFTTWPVFNRNFNLE